ncbi:putative bifunctional diguanylate cyclase/phosphodiesterase [Galenea microaerophila]
MVASSSLSQTREMEWLNHWMGSGPIVFFEWEATDGGLIHYVSQNVKSVLGLSLGSIKALGMKFMHLIHPDDRQPVQEEISQQLANKVLHFELKYRLLDDAQQVRWVKNYVAVQYGKEGQALKLKGCVLDCTHEKKAEDTLHYLTYSNSLTGLPNRNQLLQDIQAHQPCACARINITALWEINYFFGVDVGDKVLQKLGALAQTLPYKVYRNDGDEFVILFYEPCTQEALQLIIQQILDQFQNIHIEVEREVILLTFSAGVALGTEHLLCRADIALHIAKEGSNQIEFYDEKRAEEATKKLKQNLKYARALREALDHHRVICLYQPIFNLQTGTIDGFEALVRLIDSEGHMIPPDQFLPIAKRMSLFDKVTRRVIEQSCYDFKDRKEKVSINLSMEDLLNTELHAFIIQQLEATHTKLQIIFEVLETENIEDYENIKKFIDKFKALGVEISIDDFGSGYSNLQRVVGLDFDYLKLDGSLVKEVLKNPKVELLLQTIVDFAHRLGAKVVAEFVEDEAICRLMSSLGVDYVQGYWVSKPVPSEQLDQVKKHAERLQKALKSRK